MTNEELSRMYELACGRIHDETTSLYESLHNVRGEAREDSGKVYNLIQGFRRRLSIELDLISSSAVESTEDADIQQS
tara:strand:- start:8077 stop:8307 length:231 start_codon:yes stop_codon:yes gene_type:complete